MSKSFRRSPPSSSSPSSTSASRWSSLSLSQLIHLLLPLTIASFVYLYCYPLFHTGCQFPAPVSSSDGTTTTTTPSAPFRLLIYADPQIPGRSSISGLDFFRRRFAYHRQRLRRAQQRAQQQQQQQQQQQDNADRSGWRAMLPTATTAKTAARVAWELVTYDARLACLVVFKRADFWVNDWYLAHIHGALGRWARPGPTHRAVLGDLVSRQGMGDEEFEERARRYWGRIFSGMGRVDDAFTATGEQRGGGDGDEQEGKRRGDRVVEVVDPDEASVSPWATRLINVVGNHDIGYAGDISASRIERFERYYGRTNYDIFFEYPGYNQVVNSSNSDKKHAAGASGTPRTRTPSIHVINLNDLLLDGPALSTDSQHHVYHYLNTLLAQRSPRVDNNDDNDPSPIFTLLLTHVPLHKRAGICTDAPLFTMFSANANAGAGASDGRVKPGGVAEQNFLSPRATYDIILQGVFGMSGDGARGQGRKGLIVNGHDHNGCDSVHFVKYDGKEKEMEKEEEEEEEEEGGNRNAAPSSWSWSWAAEPYNSTTAAALSASESSSSPFIREVTMPSMMASYGGNAGFLSAWFDAAHGWQYELNVCSLGTQHVWWAVHALGLVTLGVCAVAAYRKVRGCVALRCEGKDKGER